MKLFSPGKTLKQRSLHAGVWSLALSGANRIIGLARTIILARLLAPQDFGLFAITSITLMALSSFSQTGFIAALIYKAGDIRHDLNVAWTAHFLRGLMRAAILLAIAALAADFFSEPAAANLIRVAALVFIIEGFTNIGTVYFRKELDYHKQFLVDFCGTLADLSTAIVAAVVLKNAWALVFGLLARNLVQFTLSYTVQSFRPRLAIDRKRLGSLWRFGVWVSLTAIVAFLGTQTAGAALGKIVGVTALGFYQMARLITQSAIEEVQLAISEAIFPTLAKLQHTTDRFRNAFLTATGISAAVLLPIAVTVFMLGADFTRIFLGVKWMPMVPALKILALSALLASWANTGMPAFLGGGQPRSLFLMQCARAAGVVIVIYPLTVWKGVYGAAAAMLVGSSLMVAVWFWCVVRQFRLSLKDLWQLVAPSLIASSAMAVVYAVSSQLVGGAKFSGGFSHFIWFGVTAVTGLGMYAIIIVSVQKRLSGTDTIKELVAELGIFAKNRGDRQ